MATHTHRISGHAAVLAAFERPDLIVPPVPTPTPGVVDMRWLRASVARFCEGAGHERRRALAVELLAAVDPAECRRQARRRATRLLGAADTAGDTPPDDAATDESMPAGDAVTRLARAVTIEVLAEALGLASGERAAEVIPAVAAIGASYQPHAPQRAEADAAVAALVAAFGGVADEPTAARIGLFAQACDATATLVAHTFAATCADGPAAGATVDELLTETLRHDPPARATRRVTRNAAQADGGGLAPDSPVVLDIAAANRDPDVFAAPDRFVPGRADGARHLAFGGGTHACPGHAHALAIAAGVVEACVERRAAERRPESARSSGQGSTSQISARP